MIIAIKIFLLLLIQCFPLLHPWEQLQSPQGRASSSDQEQSREQRSMTVSKFPVSGEVVVPGEIGINFFHPSRVFLLPCSLKQAKPRHKNEASLTLSDKAVHTALSFKGLLRS